MANVDTEGGGKPIRHRNGAWQGETQIYYVPATDTTKIFIGDFVVSAGSADASGKYPTVKQASASEALLGCVTGMGTTVGSIDLDLDSLTRNYRPGSVAMYLTVVDDKDVIFEMQEDSDGGTDIDADMIGRNINFVVGSGNTTTGVSAMELDSDSTTTSALPFRLLRVVDRPNNALGTNCKFEVCYIKHEHNSDQVGI